MTDVRRVLAVLATVLLLVSAAPVASTDTDKAVSAVNGLSVGSIHTTDTDFQNGTVNRFTISGTGDAATLTMPQDEYFEGWESYSTVTSEPDGWTSDFGLTNAQVINTRAYEGSQSYRFEDNSDLHQSITATTANLSIAFYADSSSAESEISVSEGGTQIFTVAMLNGDLQYNDGGWNTISTVPDANEWVHVEVFNVNTTTNTFGVVWETPTDSGRATGLSFKNSLSSGYDRVSLGEFGDKSFVDAIQVESGATSAQYISDTHTVTNVTQGFTDLNLADASATVEWQYYNGSAWVVERTDTYTTSGNKTVALSADSEQWRTNITISETADSRTGEIEDDGVIFGTKAPTVDPNSVQPPDGAFFESATVNLSVDVSDPDFGTPQGDTVTVEFQADGNTVGTDTLTSNGTAEVQWNNVPGGEQTITATATDSGGLSDSTTWTIETPNELYIRNESNTSELVDAPTEVEVTFIGENEIVTRTTTDGTVNMTGLPTNEEYIVTARADGWRTRTIRIQSLIQQQTVYLLNENVTAVETRFVLEDNTGEFGSSSIVDVQKPIEDNGTVEYRTIVADRFGVEGVTTYLEEGQRYRIVLRAPDGTVQEIGPYRAEASETVTIRPGSPTVPVGDDDDQGWSANAAIDNDTLEFVFSDPQGDTDLTVWIHERGNTSNQLAPNRTYTDVGNVSGIETLTANQTGTPWVVHFIQTRNGETIDYTITVSNRPNVVPGFSDEWRLIIGIGVLFVSAGVFSLLNAKVGVTVIAIEGGLLWWLGWLEGATSGAGVVLALFVAVVVNLYTNR